MACRIIHSGTRQLLNRAGSRNPPKEFCLRKIPRNPCHHQRTLITAATVTPPQLRQYPDDTVPPKDVFINLIDSTISWTAYTHHPKDPASHAILLIHKNLIPKSTGELSEWLRSIEGLNAMET